MDREIRAGRHEMYSSPVIHPTTQQSHYNISTNFFICFTTHINIHNIQKHITYNLKLTIGIYIKSNSSNIIHNVLIARFNTLVYATSNVYPPSFNNLPPSAASPNPLVFNEASAHPVKMFKSFHSDSPCRTRTSL